MTVDVYRHRTRNLLLGWTAVAALAVAVSLGGGIAMDLMLTAMSVVELFSGDDVLQFEFDWYGAALRGVGTAAMALLAWRVIRYQRVSRGACGRCGRTDTPGRDLRRLARRVAWVSVVPALGYAALKLHWAFGGDVGLADPSLFADVEPWSPGFTDTAVMAVIGVGVALAMAHRRPRLPRWLLMTPAVIGCAMLLPVAVLGTIANITAASRGEPVAALDAWVPWFVYGCFALWGPCLAFVTIEYHYGSRGACRVCGRCASIAR